MIVKVVKELALNLSFKNKGGTPGLLKRDYAHDGYIITVDFND